jgi:hypothetical protein
MAIVVIQNKLTREDVGKATEEYSNYIKVTVDLLQKIVLIGGEYHADSEKILIEKFGSKQKNIWGGGYNINSRKFEVIALVNLRVPTNDSMDILNSETRNAFLKLVHKKLSNIRLLT